MTNLNRIQSLINSFNCDNSDFLSENTHQSYENFINSFLSSDYLNSAIFQNIKSELYVNSLTDPLDFSSVPSCDGQTSLGLDDSIFNKDNSNFEFLDYIKNNQIEGIPCAPETNFLLDFCHNFFSERNEDSIYSTDSCNSKFSSEFSQSLPKIMPENTDIQDLPDILPPFSLLPCIFNSNTHLVDNLRKSAQEAILLYENTEQFKNSVFSDPSDHSGKNPNELLKNKKAKHLDITEIFKKIKDKKADLTDRFMLLKQTGCDIIEENNFLKECLCDIKNSIEQQKVACFVLYKGLKKLYAYIPFESSKLRTCLNSYRGCISNIMDILNDINNKEKILVETEFIYELIMKPNTNQTTRESLRLKVLKNQKINLQKEVESFLKTNKDAIKDIYNIQQSQDELEIYNFILSNIENLISNEIPCYQIHHLDKNLKIKKNLLELKILKVTKEIEHLQKKYETSKDGCNSLIEQLVSKIESINKYKSAIGIFSSLLDHSYSVGGLSTAKSQLQKKAERIKSEIGGLKLKKIESLEKLKRIELEIMKDENVPLQKLFYIWSIENKLFQQLKALKINELLEKDIKMIYENSCMISKDYNRIFFTSNKVVVDLDNTVNQIEETLSNRSCNFFN